MSSPTWQAQAATFLGTCFLLAMALITLWFLLHLGAGDAIYALHRRWFAIEREAYELVTYAGLGLFKLCAIFFFLLPYVGLKILQRRAAKTPGKA